MDYRIIQLTPAAQKYGNLNIRPCGKEFFPTDVFGGSSKTAGLGTPITLRVEGLPETIKTDIPTDKKTKHPRWMFRERAWAKKFVKVHNLKVGDTIVVNRIATRKYLIVPNGRDPARQRYLINTTVEDSDFVTLQHAACLVGKTPHNVRDYIQRGRINKYNPSGQRISKARNGQLRVSLRELKDFLDMLAQDHQKHHWTGLHEELGFYGLPEYERTKHVHRLHPYLGKFIPQLVESGIV